eukprot:TRINITY_DN189_c0_g1_i3.p1 TRINITY_DN189_c0_g1~~TRINITY_DN189_c0_g1_i3.p1  ORF type:complete len:406 (+),score=107.91 TRINITY_DN189_c0_g1_i3:89-1306(+)
MAAAMAACTSAGLLPSLSFAKPATGNRSLRFNQTKFFLQVRASRDLSTNDQKMVVSSDVCEKSVIDKTAEVMAGSMFAYLASTSSASAAQEIAMVADSDSRPLLLLLVLGPAVGWVLFNILKPALNQFDKMKSVKGVSAAVGLGAAASLLFAPESEAAQEMVQLADNDARPLLLLLVLGPAVGWVLFNILRPALNQFDNMRSTRSIAGAVSLGALGSLVMPSSADAAQEIMQLAADDFRPLLLLLVLGPAIGWVLFNILKPALNQLDSMKKKSIVGALGLTGLALAASPSAEAVQEVAQLAADDSRPLLLLVLGPAFGWVLFNILRPALYQLDRMSSKSVIGAASLGGLGALMAVPSADAAELIADLAADDTRPLLLLLVLGPALGWVLFNILRPALSQLEKMQK